MKTSNYAHSRQTGTGVARSKAATRNDGKAAHLNVENCRKKTNLKPEHSAHQYSTRGSGTFNRVG